MPCLGRRKWQPAWLGLPGHVSKSYTGKTASRAPPTARLLSPCRTRPMPAVVIMLLGRKGACPTGRRMVLPCAEAAASRCGLPRSAEVARRLLGVASDQGLLGSIPHLPARPRASGGPLHPLVDSTGSKLSGPGEWSLEQHGAGSRRSWRVPDIGMDAAGGRIVAATPRRSGLRSTRSPTP